MTIQYAVVIAFFAILFVGLGFMLYPLVRRKRGIKNHD